MSFFSSLMGSDGPPSLPRGFPEPIGSESLVLYQYRSCPFCQRVLRQLSALGLEDRVELRDTRQDSHARQLLRERTGRTQVPCLFIDGQPHFESADINDWLALYNNKR